MGNTGPFGPGSGGIMPSSGADPQDFYYINYAMPGAYARHMYETRTCDPLWNTFGCKTQPGVVGDQDSGYIQEEEADAAATADVDSTGDAAVQEVIEDDVSSNVVPANASLWDKIKILVTGKAAEGTGGNKKILEALAGVGIVGGVYYWIMKDALRKDAEGDLYEYEILSLDSNIDIGARDLVDAFMNDDVEETLRYAASEQLGVNFGLSSIDWSIAHDVNVPINISGTVYEKIQA
ncbi:MAG: hypothetical protein CL398_00075 [Acidiferrobacteraceae bacterium]|nr:hypothetical protein [Acidiferrobacteraceae bacterium]|tara:strand:- start:2544 stop:3251 length:708 start_codon:yes stop_codon:yes gene_type:complete